MDSINMDENDVKKLDILVAKISNLPFVEAVYLFGSQINGLARIDSDVDVSVILTDSSERNEMKIIGYGDDKFDVSVFSRMPLIIQFRIFKEGKLLFCRDLKKIDKIKWNVFKKYWDFAPFINCFYKRLLNV